MADQREDVVAHVLDSTAIHDGPDDDEVPATPPSFRRPRTLTSTAEIDSTIASPGSVRINVKGAFIVDQDSLTPPSARDVSPNGLHRETKDIRLPNHTAVVSHIAIDVRLLCRAPDCLLSLVEPPSRMPGPAGCEGGGEKFPKTKK
jgi:hypothetical protein